MKKISIFVLTVAALVGALSCNKNVASVEQQQPVDSFVGSLRINIGAAEESKAALSAMKDFQINCAQVFVFDADGKLETDVFKDLSGSPATTSTEITINTKTGNKTVYALLNHSRKYYTVGSAGLALATFEATLTDLSENDSEADLVMSGKNVVNVVDYNQQGAGGSPQLVNIFVKRLVSRIQLDNVTVDFRGKSLEAAEEFTIKKIYLKNVVGKSPIGVDGNTATAASTVMPIALPSDQYTVEGNWYSKMAPQSGVPSVMEDSFTQACTVAGTATVVNHVVFAFPNATVADNNNATWSPRHTRIVIQAHVKKASISVDKDTFYVLDLPVLVANTIYEIDNINITQLGKDDDTSDEGIKVGKETYTITVDPWNPTVTHLNYEF